MNDTEADLNWIFLADNRKSRSLHRFNNVIKFLSGSSFASSSVSPHP